MKFSTTKMLYFFLLLPVLYFTGCCSNPVKYIVSSDFKRYFIFPDGSYWVYKNQSGEFDTLILKSHTSTFVSDPGPESCSEHEFIECEYEISYSSSKTMTNISAWDNESSSFYDISSFFPEFASDTSEAFQFGQKYNYNKDFISEMVIQGVKYTNVNSIEIDITHYSNINGNQPIYGYFVRDIGLVKRVLYDGTNWELVDYKIYK